MYLGYKRQGDRDVEDDSLLSISVLPSWSGPERAGTLVDSCLAGACERLGAVVDHKHSIRAAFK